MAEHLLYIGLTGVGRGILSYRGVHRSYRGPLQVVFLKYGKISEWREGGVQQVTRKAVWRFRSGEGVWTAKQKDLINPSAPREGGSMESRKGQEPVWEVLMFLFNSQLFM